MNITKEEISKFSFDRQGLVKKILESKPDRDLMVEWKSKSPKTRKICGEICKIKNGDFLKNNFTLTKTVKMRK